MLYVTNLHHVSACTRVSLRLFSTSHPRDAKKFSFSLSKPKPNSTQTEKVATSPEQDVQHVRTRFAPSPTGFLHLGSLRTLLYNYLFAKASKGTFILRIEDTDQKRRITGAEESIYTDLKWLGIQPDEGPGTYVGEYGPYRQSDRSEIYLKYSNSMLEKGHAYRCFCSQDRLGHLRESAKRLKPPTTVSYDRHCISIPKEESDSRAASGEQFTVRFKSPEVYPHFHDLLHGEVNHQPQVNYDDRRYDDFVLMKSDNLPTYHFANVIDDHLMKITHVIRGEEWLASTAKHIALYNMFGWKTPSFIHIPLLTSLADKKLSKRTGDINISKLKDNGYLPEALINFSVLFGWSPKRKQGEALKELYRLEKLESIFSLDGLTVGNAKVEFKKLDYFNKIYLGERLQDPQYIKSAVESVKDLIQREYNLTLDDAYLKVLITKVAPSVTTLNELASRSYDFFYSDIAPNPADLKENFKTEDLTASKLILAELIKQPVSSFSPDGVNKLSSMVLKSVETELGSKIAKPIFFQTLRYALTNQTSGISLHLILQILTEDQIMGRIQQCHAALAD